MSAKKNKQSADYLAKEVAAERVIKEVEQPIQISRFGVIPKSGEPNNWRLIVDIFNSYGKSINISSILYVTVDQAVLGIILKLRPAGMELAKVDVEKNYWNIPVHCEDRFGASLWSIWLKS